jgi:hypothetical protein
MIVKAFGFIHQAREKNQIASQEALVGEILSAHTAISGRRVVSALVACQQINQSRHENQAEIQKRIQFK